MEPEEQSGPGPHARACFDVESQSYEELDQYQKQVDSLYEQYKAQFGQLCSHLTSIGTEPSQIELANLCKEHDNFTGEIDCFKKHIHSAMEKKRDSLVNESKHSMSAHGPHDQIAEMESKFMYTEQEASLKRQQLELIHQQRIAAAEAERQRAEIEIELALVQKKHELAMAKFAVEREGSEVKAEVGTESSPQQFKMPPPFRSVPEFCMPPPAKSSPQQFKMPPQEFCMPPPAKSSPQQFKMPPQEFCVPPLASTPDVANSLTNFLLRKDLSMSRLHTFNDKPENYYSWKSTFTAVCREMKVSEAEEIDLMIKYLGTDSKRQLTSLKSAYIHDPFKALNAIWERLEDRFGAPERVYHSTMRKLETFPRINFKDSEKLYDLSDTLAEVEALKDNPMYSVALSYFDSSVGVSPIVSKLPHSWQEKWISRASNYKKSSGLPFPPFTVFCEFIRELSRIRNDPAFMFKDTQTAVPSIERRDRRNIPTRNFNVSAKKTVIEKDTTNTNRCPIHKARHSLSECKAFKSKTFDQKRALLKANKICFKCCNSSEHMARDCNQEVKCSDCSSNFHCTAMHMNGPVARESGQSVQSGEGDNPIVTPKCTQVCGNKLSTSKSCAKYVLVNVYEESRPDNKIQAYAILDDQSNRSLAKPELFSQLNITSEDYKYTLNSCSGTKVASGRRASNCVIETINGTARLRLPTLVECTEVPNLREEIPTPAVALHHPHLNPIVEHIPEINDEAEILLLIGRDLVEAHIVHDQIVGTPGAPYAQKLSLGWVIIGETCLGNAHQPDTINVNKTFVRRDRASIFPPCTNNFIIKEDNSMCDLFATTKHDEKLDNSIEDKQFLEVMDSQMQKDPEGNWTAPLPFRTGRQRLPNNRPVAMKRARILHESLRRDPKKTEHLVTFMENIISKGHAEIAPPVPESEECWYLPLFGVYNDKKPDQIRGVFDASASYEDVSLNDVLLSGPDLINSLLGILLRFREEAVAISADIQQMFYCFKVNISDRNFLRFIWYKDNDPDKELIDYRMKVHVFGNKPSPAVANYGLCKTAALSAPEFGEDVKKFVMNNFYVDDGLTSVETPEMAIDLMKRSQAALQTNGNIRLHKVASNSQTVLNAFPPEELAKDLSALDLYKDNLPVQRSLGLYWNLEHDTFTFQMSNLDKPFTRRGMLSVVNSLYDPLGLIAPVTIVGKLIIKKVTAASIDWDEPLSPAFEYEWCTWIESLHLLQDLQIRRQYLPHSLRDLRRLRLLLYCDASEKAVAAVAYLCGYLPDGTALTSFVLGKAKVAPDKIHTIPRLELCAAVLAVELADIVQEHLDADLDTVEYYTDSKVVLGYICNDTRRFHTYVSNRVARIRRSSEPSQWKYVNTIHNPADVATRGVHAENMASSIWLEGPAPPVADSHKKDDEDNAYSLIDPDSDKEVRAQVNAMFTNSTGDRAKTLSIHRFERFSTWDSLVKAIACLVHVAKSRSVDDRCSGWHMCAESHSVENFEWSENLILKAVQVELYPDEHNCLEAGKPVSKHSSLSSLNPFLDANGLMRVGGRLTNSELASKEKNPIIVPGKCHVATLLVRHYHQKVQHQGRHFTEGIIRSAGLWITGGKRLVSSIIHNCVKCRKLRGRLENQKMADLPADRVKEAPPFTYVGVDCFGPWQVATRRTRGIQTNSKRWAVMFTCLSMRAIHIEVIDEMSSSAFINALRRFVAIRGKVKEYRSDRGTNFVGATDDLEIDAINVEKPSFVNHLQENGSVWKFNVPHSSHFGGSWERMIGVSRRILESMMADVKNLTHDVITTLMAEVCAIVNSRPLIPVTYDSEHPQILTPATILTHKTEADIQTITEIDVKDIYRSQWKRVKHLADVFWARWRKEYLQTLQPRRKWTDSQPNIQSGDVILLRDKTVSRNEWPIGIVLDVFPSSDDRVRKVQVRVIRDGKPVTYIRPIVELVLLIRKQ